MRIFLIRHAAVEPIGKWLTGRQPGVHLNEKGQMQAQQLVEKLMDTKIAAIYSSPLERAQETAQPLARSKNLRVRTCNDFTDVHFGDWTGKTFAQLDGMPAWRSFNAARASARPPGGETMLEVMHRMAGAIESLRAQHEMQHIAIVSHCDPIRSAIIRYSAMNLDSILRISIDPASVSVLDVDCSGGRVLALNIGGEWNDSLNLKARCST